MTLQKAAPQPVEAEDLTSQNNDSPCAEPEPAEVVVNAKPFIRTRPYELRSGKK